MRDKVREKRLRQIARSAGLLLVRSRTWRRRSPAYGTYALIDDARCTLVLADPETGYGLTLDEVEDYLRTFTDRRAHASG